MRMMGMLVFVTALAAAGLAQGGDGVVEINQAAALAGIDANDPPGFPVIISDAGSYRLTGNLVVSDSNTEAIRVSSSASLVSLDLSGHLIQGPITCDTFPTTSCPAEGTGSGIRGFSRTLRVHSGLIQGFDAWCVRGNKVVAFDLVVRECAAGGIRTSGNSIVRDNQISTVGGPGVWMLGGGGLTTGNTIDATVGFGILNGTADTGGGALDDNAYGGNTLRRANGIRNGHEIAPNVCGSGTDCTTSACLLGVEQPFGLTMSGCGATRTWPDRATVCAPGYRVCTAAEWANRTSTDPPANNYWTDDDLRFRGTSGACWAHETDGFTCPPDQPMRVCSGTTDSIGNTCTWINCGYHTATPSQFFGGCSSPTDDTAGTLCCLR